MDLAIINFILELRGYFWIDFTFHFFGYILPYLLIVFLAIIILKDRKMYQVSVLSALLVSGFTKVMLIPFEKFLYRDRPFVLLEIEKLIPKEATASFPSSHSAFFFALATVLYFKNKKIGIFLYISAGLISFSRVYAGIHWPSDVFVGALLGLIVGLIYQVILEKINKK